MFDPEKVQRWEDAWQMDGGGMVKDDEGTYVEFSDYERLLEIHMRHVVMIAELFKKCGAPLSEEKITSLKNGTWV